MKWIDTSKSYVLRFAQEASPLTLNLDSIWKIPRSALYTKPNYKIILIGVDQLEWIKAENLFRRDTNPYYSQWDYLTYTTTCHVWCKIYIKIEISKTHSRDLFVCFRTCLEWVLSSLWYLHMLEMFSQQVNTKCNIFHKYITSKTNSLSRLIFS